MPYPVVVVCLFETDDPALLHAADAPSPEALVTATKGATGDVTRILAVMTEGEARLMLGTHVAALTDATTGAAIIRKARDYDRAAVGRRARRLH